MLTSERVLWRAVLVRALADLLLREQLSLEEDLADASWFSLENEDYVDILCLAGVREEMMELLVKDTISHMDAGRLERLCLLAELSFPD